MKPDGSLSYPAQGMLFAGLASQLHAAGFRGEILQDPASRAAMSTDNSVYQIVPDLVLCPLNEDDIRCALLVMAQPLFANVPVTARGGGTGTNGQSLNSGVIFDLRRHMTAILEVNTKAQWVEVEPGIVLDDLNARLAETGLFFAPSTSTANRCTIGGMVSTDASGKGSRVYGKTSDNVLGVRLALDGGQVLDSDQPAEGWATSMLSELAAACLAGRAALLERVPKLARRFTGYDLERALPSRGQPQWWRLVIGAEGTLGVITRVRLKLTKRPKLNVLYVLAFAQFYDALEAGEALLAADPLAIETLDGEVQSRAEQAGLLDDLPSSLRGVEGARPVYNFVELFADSANALASKERKLKAIMKNLKGLSGQYIARSQDEISHLWSIRSASVGLLGASSTTQRPIAFVEDCVVPPANLVAFVKDFTKILKSYGLRYGIYGHVDVGCLHVRPALNVDQVADRKIMKEVSDLVYAATRRHGGIFWGEHGKGIRGEYLEEFVGPEAYSAFRRIKAAFDPRGRFNPGKLVGAHGQRKTIVDTPMRRVNSVPADPFAKAFTCNGNAACLTYAQTVPLCPSFKATNDLRHSPKGRAEILRMWREGDGSSTKITESAFEALDGCLGCNACASSCPAHVAIPEMKSHFLDAYYRGKIRPLGDLAALALESYAGILDKSRSILKLAEKTGLVWLGATMVKLRDLPSFSTLSPNQLDMPVARRGAIAQTTKDPQTVLLLQDTFTSLFDVETVQTVGRVLSRLGYKPVLLTLQASGKAAHVLGDRKKFTAQSRAMRSLLEEAAATQMPIVGLDPAQTLMIRQDYPRAANIVPVEVLLIQEFLSHRLGAGDKWPQVSGTTKASVFLHCTEASAKPDSGNLWREVLSRFGIDAEIVSTGCCGMAGLYGHQKHHFDTSKKLYEMSWRAPVEKAQTVFATGFSCRSQTDRMSGRKTYHPLKLIEDVLQSQFLE